MTLLSRLFNKKKESRNLRTRIAERKACGEEAFYKILDRGHFYTHAYEGVKSHVRLIDISTTGCAFKAKGLLPSESFIEIEIARLSEAFIFDKPIIAACEIVYNRYIDRSTNRVGAKFLEISPEDIDLIRQFTE